MWAGFVARYWWPAEARRELGNALSELSALFFSRDEESLIDVAFVFRFCLNIGWLYTRLVVANSAVSETFINPITLGEISGNVNGEGIDERRSTLLTRQDNPRLYDSVRVFMAMCVLSHNLSFVSEPCFLCLQSHINDTFIGAWPACLFLLETRELHLQIKLIELQGLLAQTQHEPRLKGPFPVVMYRKILTSLQTILDKLHSMRCVTTREEW